MSILRLFSSVFDFHLILALLYVIIKTQTISKGDDMPMKESGEMYIESIYVLCGERQAVRSIDVAEHMNYSKPSVSRAVGLLKKDGYITVDKDGYISLTELGKEKGKNIFERHTILTKMLISLGVDEETADEDACRMEHVISEKTFNAMKKHFSNNK